MADRCTRRRIRRDLGPTRSTLIRSRLVCIAGRSSFRGIVKIISRGYDTDQRDHDDRHRDTTRSFLLFFFHVLLLDRPETRFFRRSLVRGRDRLFSSFEVTVGRKTVFCKEYLWIVVRLYLIPNTHPRDLQGVLDPVRLKELKHGRTKTSGEISFLDSNDRIEILGESEYHSLIDRFDEARVND